MGRSGFSGGRSSGGGGGRSSGGRSSGGGSRGGFGGGSRSSGSFGSSRSSGGFGSSRSSGSSRSGVSLFGGSSRSGGSRSSGGLFGGSGGSRSPGGFGSSSRSGSSGPSVSRPGGRTGSPASKPPADGFGTPTRWSAPRPTYTHSSGFGGPGGLFGRGIGYTGRSSSNQGSTNGGYNAGGNPFGSTGNRTFSGGNVRPTGPMRVSPVGSGSRPAGSPTVDRGVRGCGCLTAPVIIIAALLILFLLGFNRCGTGILPWNQQNTASSQNAGQGNGKITVSTVRRTKLSAGTVKETGYYTDELGWIGNTSTLTKGLRNFYKRTGVQPYLYITDTVLGTHYPTNSQLDEYARTLYEELFEDEGHLLLLFFEYDSEYSTWYVAGNAASTVIDSEAADILFDYIDRYYFTNLSDEEMFSKAFDEASQRMMTVTVSPWVYVGVTFLVLVILVVALIWWAIAKKKKKEEEERMKEILNTPLETYADADLKAREEKYGTGSAAPPSAPPGTPGQNTDVPQ